MSPNVNTNSAPYVDLCRMTLEETKRRLDELAREYVATHNAEIVEELYRLARELETMDEE